jgi:hypothetical protein
VVATFAVLLTITAGAITETPLPSCAPTAAVDAPGAAAPEPAIPAGPVTFEVVAQYGGRLESIAAGTRYIYAGVGARLIVLDPSNPTGPVEIGATGPLPGTPLDVVVRGSVAYLAAGEGGVAVIDVSNPLKPQLAGAVDTAGYAEGIAIAGDYAYVADGPNGLRVIDIHDAAHPRDVAGAFTSYNVLGVAVNGGRAWLAAAGAGLLVVDVSNPRAPVEIGHAKTNGYAWSVAVDGTVAYVADAWSGITLMDVHQPWRPSIIASEPAGGWTFDLELSGNTLRAASGAGGLEIFDVTNRTRPVRTASLPFETGHAHRVAANATHTIVADRNHGVRLVDASTMSAPALLSTWSPLGFADGVAVDGSHAWVAADSYGVSLIDLSGGREVVRLEAPERYYPKNVSVAKQHAFVTTQFGSALGVIDARDPANPWSAWFKWPFHSARNHAVVGGLLIIPNEWGLRFVNITDPRAPCELSFLNFTGSGPESPGPSGGPVATGIATSGHYAFVAATGGGMWVVDFTDPRAPRKVAEHRESETGEQPAWYEDLALFGQYVYVFGKRFETAILRVIDVADPLHPVGRGSVGVPIGAAGWGPFVAATSTTAFIADRLAGLVAVDVRDPDRPLVAGRFTLPGPASAVVLDGERLYVAAEHAGLFVLQARSSASAAGASTSQTFGRVVIPPAREPRSATAGAVIRAATRQDASCVVRSTADTGDDSLRGCLRNAAAGTTITFDPAVFPPSAPASIKPLTPLGEMRSGGVTIDASNAGVILDGSSAPDRTTGLMMRSDGNRIMGLQIIGFSGDGLSVRGASNVIGGDRSRGSGPSGEGNVISGNGLFGVRIHGSRNKVAGNYIGVDVTGRLAMGNRLEGVTLGGGGTGNTVGGPSIADRNVISGSGETDVHVVGSSQNQVVGNYIGTDATGRVRLSNVGYWSIAVEGGAPANLIQSNVVVGGLHTGVSIVDAGSSYNQVLDNLIGLDAAGNESLSGGIIASDEAFNRIERNVVTGTVSVYGRAEMNVVARNLIGTNAAGDRAIGTGAVGITVQAKHNFIGGPDPGDGNVVTGRIHVSAGSTLNVLAGNSVGTGLDGSRPLIASYFNGINLAHADANFIQDNRVQFVRYPGIAVSDGSRRNVLRRNFVSGTRAGIEISQSDFNFVHGNALVGNDSNGSDGGAGNSWDDGSRGNHWNDYAGTDANGDGIGDVVRQVPPNGVDRFPLTSPEPFHPAPAISDVTPRSVKLAGGAFTLTVRGSGFVRGATVLWDGFPLTTTWVGTGELRAAVEPPMLSTAGRHPIAVVNPSPGGGTSSDAVVEVSGGARRRIAGH